LYVQGEDTDYIVCQNVGTASMYDASEPQKLKLSDTGYENQRHITQNKTVSTWVPVTPSVASY
jgi:hypothetical protein